MTRLTKDMCATISLGLIEHTFNSRVAALVVERAQIAQEIYDLHYKPDMKRINDLPEGWLPVHSSIAFESVGSRYNYHFSGQLFRRWSSQFSFQHLKANQPIHTHRRFKQSDNGAVEVFDAKHPIAVRVEKHEAAAAALHNEVLTAWKTAGASLDNFTTVEKLLDEWPEVKPFVPAAVAPTPSLPALPTQHLNKMFDLPVGDE